MKRVGLIGEHSNDTSAIESLLLQKYGDQVHFTTLSKNLSLNGGGLDSPKALNIFSINFLTKNCDFVICIRDLDGFESEKAKLKIRKDWFLKVNHKLNEKGILLLNIWELEALIFADIDVFNKRYGTKLSGKRNPLFIKDPKTELIRATRNSKKEFDENHCPKIFKELGIDNIIKNHSKFRDFINIFEIYLKPNKT